MDVQRLWSGRWHEIARLPDRLTDGCVAGASIYTLSEVASDREAARLARINVWFYDTLLIVLTALVIVAAMQILGAILVAGMLVIPVAAAMQVTNSFNHGIALSIAFGQVAVIGGILIGGMIAPAAANASAPAPLWPKVAAAR